MKISRLTVAVAIVAAVGCAPKRPAVTTAPSEPKYPSYPVPEIPAALGVDPAVRTLHDDSWRALQAGNLTGASRGFLEALKLSPTFYPSETALGFVRLAEQNPKDAAVRFTSALNLNDRYLPAWQGLAEAHLALGDEGAAIPALERILVLDPSLDAVRTKLEVLRLRQVQLLVESGRRARSAGRLSEAQANLERALKLSPASAAILVELAIVETAAGSLGAAESHARRAIELDGNDAEAHAALGAALEASGRPLDASPAYARAATLDPRPAWKERSERLREKAETVAVPAEFRDIATAQIVTRAQVAAMLGLRLTKLVRNSTRQTSVVVTDVRGHWAEPWILMVTQSGLMTVFPNHTFQPQALVRRSDLALILTHVLEQVGTPEELAKWKAARPRFVDLPVTNVFYPAAALAVSSGAMAMQEGNRFAPTRSVTGAMVVSVVERIEQLAARK
jgi:tetratricopeptide (TPR) repeat protein